jgi:hypothetical protein
MQVNAGANAPAFTTVICPAEFFGWTAAEWGKRAAPRPEIVALNPEASQSWIWHYSHPEKDIDYLFVFSGKEIHRPIEFQFGTRGRTHSLALTLPALSAGVIRIQDGLITDLLAKGENEETLEKVVITCRLDEKTISAGEAGDWVFPDGKKLKVEKNPAPTG